MAEQNSLKQRIEEDLKTALLAGQKERVTTLRGLKSAILYAEVAAKKREQGLNELEITAVLQKEAKKRKESAELYQKASDTNRAEAELKELEIIGSYLPEQLSDEELTALIDQAIKEIGGVSGQTIGKIIGRVKELSKGKIEGSRIAEAVKRRLA